jgi:hypothetical protein
MWHGHSVYRTAHVPLFIRWPGRVPAGRRVDRWWNRSTSCRRCSISVSSAPERHPGIATPLLEIRRAASVCLEAEARYQKTVMTTAGVNPINNERDVSWGRCDQ